MSYYKSFLVSNKQTCWTESSKGVTHPGKKMESEKVSNHWMWNVQKPWKMWQAFFYQRSQENLKIIEETHDNEMDFGMRYFHHKGFVYS
jgi:hypothetical protein